MAQHVGEPSGEPAEQNYTITEHCTAQPSVS